ncbi:hypothetical protein ACRRTK_024958 [Alexandromys fortis]
MTTGRVLTALTFTLWGGVMPAGIHWKCRLKPDKMFFLLHAHYSCTAQKGLANHRGDMN